MKSTFHRLSVGLATLTLMSAARAESPSAKIEFLESVIRNNQEARSRALQKEILAQKKIQSTLEGVILRNVSPAIAGEARWQLAAIIAQENPKRARFLIQEALTLAKSTSPTPWNLYANILLISADLYAKDRKFESAMRGFSDVVDNSDAMSTLPDTLQFRLRLATGDNAFMSYFFETAQKQYELAYKLASRSTGPTQRELDAAKTLALLRMTWAGFRGGNYHYTTQYGLELLRKWATSTDFDQKLVDETVAILGTALFESASEEDFVAFASDALAGDMGKKAVVVALNAFSRAGRAAEIRSLAQAVDKHFLTSAQLVDFMDTRRAALRKLGDKLPYSEESALTVERLTLGSPWLKSVTLNAKQERARAALVLESVAESANYFEQEAIKTRSKPLYLRTHQLLRAWLDELPPGERRGSLFLRAGQMALMGDDAATAESSLRRSLEFSQSESERRSAHFMLVEATRKIALARTPHSAKSDAIYTGAVDAFVRAFPTDTAARNALFESGRNAESRGDELQARERFERLLTIIDTGGPFDHLERERVYTALIALNARDTNARRSKSSLADLERFAQNEQTTKTITALVRSANAAAARSYAAELRRKGQLADAAQSLVDWGREHANNPETPHVLLDATRDLFELGLWSDSVEAANLLIANFRQHKLAPEALYWRGRAQEANLGFASATDSYSMAALDESTSLDLPIRVDALERALSIYSNLNDKPWAGTVLAKLAALRAKLGDKEGAWRDALASGRNFLDSKRSEDASVVFDQLRRQKGTPRSVHEEATIGFLASSLKIGGDPISIHRQLDSIFNKLFAQCRKSKENGSARFSLSRVAFILASEELDEAREIRATVFANLNTKGLERLRQLDAALVRRVQQLRSLPYISADNPTFTAFLELRNHMQREFSGTVISSGANDKRANRYHEDAIALSLETQRLAKELLDRASEHRDRFDLPDVLQAKLRNAASEYSALELGFRTVLPDDNFNLSALETGDGSSSTKGASER